MFRGHDKSICRIQTRPHVIQRADEPAVAVNPVTLRVQAFLFEQWSGANMQNDYSISPQKSFRLFGCGKDGYMVFERVTGSDRNNGKVIRFDVVLRSRLSPFCFAWRPE